MIPDLTDTPLTDLVSLAGRRAVVTGGARGIGAAIVRRLAEAGADVVVGDLDADEAAAVAASVAAATGRRAIGVALDVTDTASLAAAADRCVAELGGLEIWVNNAGIYPTTGPAIDAADDFIDRMLQVNLRGTFAGAREAAKRMDHGGVIVNLASTAGFRGAPGISAYVASKHAVVGLTKNLAIELAPKDIRVVGVAPGVIDTPGVQEQLAPLKAAGLDVGATINRSPLGRGGKPDDVARVVLMLASDLAAWVTGSVVPVEAGALAGG
ncbi:MAG: glucose 1-dehydrogenase [Ilumatobacteraceae bacterium]|jgi:NAD(P)-dependent dehydrogenase (short-subunit alcohol dehydrogenase family)|nr:glucose 1-dehydrogenase [Ilumatobacteraceae bacterium]